MKKRFFRTGCEKSIHNYVLISKMIKFLRIKNCKTIFILDLFTILSALFINIFFTRTRHVYTYRDKILIYNSFFKSLVLV